MPKPDTRLHTYTGDRQLKRAIRREGYKMTRAERKALWDSLPEGLIFTVHRQDRGHRKAYRMRDRNPVAFTNSVAGMILSEKNGIVILEPDPNKGFLEKLKVQIGEAS